MPRVVGKIRRRGPVEVRDVEFLLRNTDRATKITLPGPFTLSQQAQNAFYADDEEMAMDYAVAVNEELRALKATGVDVVQLDEPWVRTSPEKATRYGLRAINRALEGIEGPTVVHLCFGYAAVVPSDTKPSGYSFLPQLADTVAQQISIEAAQPKLDLGVLRDLAGKQIMLGVLDLGDPAVETAGDGGGADSRRAALRGAGAPDSGAGLRHEIPAARDGVRQVAGAGGRCRDRAAGVGRVDAARGHEHPLGLRLLSLRFAPLGRFHGTSPCTACIAPIRAGGIPPGSHASRSWSCVGGDTVDIRRCVSFL